MRYSGGCSVGVAGVRPCAFGALLSGYATCKKVTPRPVAGREFHVNNLNAVPSSLGSGLRLHSLPQPWSSDLKHDNHLPYKHDNQLPYLGRGPATSNMTTTHDISGGVAVVVQGQAATAIVTHTEEIFSPDPLDSSTRPLALMPRQWLQRVPNPQTHCPPRPTTSFRVLGQLGKISARPLISDMAATSNVWRGAAVLVLH